MPMPDDTLAMTASASIGADSLSEEQVRHNALSVSNLSFAVDGQPLVDGISLDLDSRSLTMVMGPNGAGKSLFLRLVHGLLEPTGGSVEWSGQALDDSIRRRQAMVFQKPVLLRRSVAANMDFVLRLSGRTDPDRRAELLERVGLLHKLKQPARLLSSGEQQRLALARALAIEPDVLFLDEPTASLDPASVLLIEEIVSEVHRRGVKVIFITHDLGQARRLAGDVVFLHRGRLAEHQPATKFFDNPLTPAARAYLDGRIVI